jgi:cell filamentation protein
MFDPFGDFAQAGYLRNVDGLKDLDEVKVQEHAFFLANVEEALATLRKKRGPIEYRDFLKTHRILFGGFYPWAGKDRLELGVGQFVGKGERVHFEAAERCRMAVDHGLQLGNDRDVMRAQPGTVMGMFAWGHPFLDGNGRAMLVIHAELCRRASMSIDWTASTKEGYLEALTRELADPGKHLDTYLLPLARTLARRANLAEYLKTLPGLDGLEEADENIAYAADDPAAIAAYLEAKRTRGESA